MEFLPVRISIERRSAQTDGIAEIALDIDEKLRCMQRRPEVQISKPLAKRDRPVFIQVLRAEVIPIQMLERAGIK